MRINSNDGTYKESFQLSGVNQRQRFGICTLSDDESALFWVGRTSSKNKPSYTAIIRFDTNSTELQLVISNEKLINSNHLDLSASNIYEMYFIALTNDHSYHMIKGTFNFDENLYKEDFHKSMVAKGLYTSAKMARD